MNQTHQINDNMMKMNQTHQINNNIMKMNQTHQEEYEEKESKEARAENTSPTKTPASHLCAWKPSCALGDRPTEQQQTM